MVSWQALVSFFSLTLVHISAAIVYKLSQQGGRYEFSPASTLVLAEIFKILLSFSLHCMTSWRPDPRSFIFSRWISGIKFGLVDAMAQLNRNLVGQLFGLSLSYAAYNQLQFLMFLWADASSVILIRSTGSILSAFMAWWLLSRGISSSQWLSICLQACGLILVQYDACLSKTSLLPIMYLMLFLHVSLSSFNSIWNENIVKCKGTTSLNVQNLVLYSFGAAFNLIAYFILPNSLYGTSPNTSFFSGYNIGTIFVIVLNSIIGLVVTAVYKYADVIIKTFALACATGTLFFFEYMFFNRSFGMDIVIGIAVVYVSSYLYFGYANLPSQSSSLFNASQSPLLLPKHGLKSSSDESIKDIESGQPSSSQQAGNDNNNAEQVNNQKVPLFLICLPDFLVQKHQINKRSNWIALIVVLIVMILIGTHSNQLNRITPKKPIPTLVPLSPNFIDQKIQKNQDTWTLDMILQSIGAVFGGEGTTDEQNQVASKTQEGVINTQLKSVKIKWKNELEMRNRSFDETNSVDRLKRMIAVRKMTKEKLRYSETINQNENNNDGNNPFQKELAICFIGRMGPSKHVSLTWETTLNLWVQSYDKFVVTGHTNQSHFSKLLSPVATKHIFLPTLDLSKQTFANPDNSKVGDHCNLTDWVYTLQTVSECGQLLEHHKAVTGISYKWVWITEPSVVWVKPLPALGSLATHRIFLRRQKWARHFDPTCMFGAYDNMIRYSALLFSEVFTWTGKHDPYFFLTQTAKLLSISLLRTDWLPHHPDIPVCIDTEAPFSLKTQELADRKSQLDREKKKQLALDPLLEDIDVTDESIIDENKIRSGDSLQDRIDRIQREEEKEKANDGNDDETQNQKR